MNSIDDLALEFFDDVVVPCRTAALSSGALPPMRPDPLVESYFSAPVRSELAANDFVIAEDPTPAELAEQLRARWAKLPALHPLADALPALLQGALRHADRAERAIPAFNYVLY